MTITLALHPIWPRRCALALAVAGCLGFAGLVVTRFVTEVVADPVIGVEQGVIEATARSFPDASPVWSRLAARVVEGTMDEDETPAERAARALEYAGRAVRLAPWQYENWLLLAAAREMNDQPADAEAALREALRRAPGNTRLHWRLANLLVRQDRMPEALRELRGVTRDDPSLLLPSLSLVWQANEGRIADVEAVTDGAPKSRLTLARFLAQQDQVEAAVSIFKSVDRQARLQLPEETGALIGDLLAAKQPVRAADLWRDCVRPSEDALLWNGDFETAAPRAFAQFDWQIGTSRYADIGLSSQAHTGERSLRIRYAGKETTRLDGEIRQLVVLEPGKSYRLEAFVMTENLLTPDGPRLALERYDSKATVAVSEPVPSGSRGWKSLAVEFTAPADAPALWVTIRQTPQFSYAPQTAGSVWFDGFRLKAREEEKRKSRN